MAADTPIMTWQIEEYSHREKSPDWFWALGVIAIAGAAIAVIYHDALFAIFIIMAALILGYFAAREPKIIEISINEGGIKIREFVYPYKKLKGFAVEEHRMGNKLLIESDRLINPVISIPIPYSLDTDELSAILEAKIPKLELAEHPSHRILEHIGF